VKRTKREVIVHRFYADGKNMFVAEWYEPFSLEKLIEKAAEAKKMGYGEAEFVTDTTGRLVNLKDLPKATDSTESA
jgi:hypothetical protein